MLYTCPQCGGCFDTKQFTTKPDNTTVVKCKYCGVEFEFKSIHVSHVTNGYNALASGRYTEATKHFGYALDLKHEDRSGTIKDLSYVDAHLGRALSQFDVQIVYNEQIGMDEAKPPIIICHTPHKERFQDANDFLIAVELVESIPDRAHRERKMKRLMAFAEYIDGINDYYNRLEREGKEYQLFIAFEDLSKDRAEAYHMATTIHKLMANAQKINRVFCPNPDEADENMITYEAKILYALNHSQCMLALVDRDVDNRLIEMYSRFDAIRNDPVNRSKRIQLGFVRYSGQYQIHLNNQRVQENIFQRDDEDQIINFVLAANNIRGMGPIPVPVPVPQGVPVPVPVPSESVGTSHPPVFIDDNHVVFGNYPQSREMSLTVKKFFFDKYGRPNPAAPGAWNSLYLDRRNGQPYSWYVDDEVDGVRYRAVYFSRYRDVFTVNEENPRAESQRKNNYLNRDIYVFRFEPVTWYVLRRMRSGVETAILVCSRGLDAMAFNENRYDNEWRHSTLADWMNGEFADLLFTPEEQEWLFSFDGRKLGLLNVDREMQSPEARRTVGSFNIGGTDYFRCIGGSIFDGNVNAYWVESEAYLDADRAAVIFPSVTGKAGEMPSDCTTVAVVPSIEISIPNNR